MGRLLITTDPIVWRDLTLLLDSPTRVSFSSEAKKAISAANSSGSPILLAGMDLLIAASILLELSPEAFA